MTIIQIGQKSFIKDIFQFKKKTSRKLVERSSRTKYFLPLGKCRFPLLCFNNTQTRITTITRNTALVGKTIFNAAEFSSLSLASVVDKAEVSLNKTVLIDDLSVEKLKIKNILILI